MSDEVTTYQRLAAPFDVSEHARVQKGGMQQTYAPWTAYVERLNDVLGPEQWSFRVVREGFTDTECWVLGEITATIDGVTVTRQQYGCEPITKGRNETPTTDLLKTAASDAIKKAASLIGPGLYLSIKEEREAIERAMREAQRPQQQPTEIRGVPVHKPTPPGPRKANVEGCMIAWNTAVKRTRFDDAETASKYVAYYTKDAHKTLEAFFGAATEDEATAFLKAINDRVAKEAREAAAS